MQQNIQAAMFCHAAQLAQGSFMGVLSRSLHGRLEAGVTDPLRLGELLH